jgi:hypothetical protein
LRAIFIYKYLLVTITNLLETGSMNWFIFDASPNQPDSRFRFALRDAR